MCIGRHVKNSLFLLDFNETRIFSTDFRNIRKYQISRKSAQWETSSSMRADVRTDKRDELIVAFRNFTNAPENGEDSIDLL
jgi:hypothetical protein